MEGQIWFLFCDNESEATSFGKTCQSGNTWEMSYGISQALNPGTVWVQMVNLTLCQNIILWKHIQGMELMLHTDTVVFLNWWAMRSQNKDVH